MQAAKISQLEKQIQTLKNDKAELARQRDSALKDVEGTINRYPKRHYLLYANSLM